MVIQEKMLCNRCYSDQNELIILRKERFTTKGKRGNYVKYYHRVCLFCFAFLIKQKFYKINNFWKEFIEQLVGDLK